MDALIPLRLSLVLAYPPLIYMAHHTGETWLRGLMIPLAVLVLFVPALLRFRPGAWILLAAAGLVGLAVALRPEAGLWPPVAVTAGLGAWFAFSLLPSREPVLGDMARQIHARRGEPLPDEAEPWLRYWTAVWAGFLLAAAAGLAGLALGGQLQAWVLLALGLPAVTLGLLVVEWALRQRVFPHQAHPGLVEFLVSLAGVYQPGRRP